MTVEAEPLTAEEQALFVESAEIVLDRVLPQARMRRQIATNTLRWHATVKQLEARVTLLATQLQAGAYDVKEQALRMKQLEARVAELEEALGEYDCPMTACPGCETIVETGSKCANERGEI